MFLKRFFTKNSLISVSEFFLDTLFPFFCLGCQRHGFWLCPTCLSSLPLRNIQHCPQCFRNITPSGQVCFACKDASSPAIDGIFVASYYKERLLSRIIHSYKYRFVAALAKPLGEFLGQTLTHSSLPLPDLIIPVPLHPRRLRFRGFNQSALLAKELSLNLLPALEIPLLTEGLLRTRYTKPQMKTDSREERLMNLRGAFALAPGTENSLNGKSIWLIDDVATTGTTLEECALLLKKNGALSVFGIVLGR